MKSKFIVLSLAGILAGGNVILAQSSAPAADTNQPTAAAQAAAQAALDAANAPAAAPAAAAAVATTASAGTTAPAATADTNAAATTAPTLAQATPSAPAAPATDSTATAPAATNAPDATAAAPAATNAPDSNATQPPASTATASAATNSPDTNAPAANTSPDTNVATSAAPPATNAPDTGSAPVASTDTNSAAAPAAPAAPDANAVIPLIVMDEVPLTDAIKNLARQAGLNYMLDPKINYGAPGPDGRPIPQPLVSLRWENLTPDQALTAVLNNYNLVIMDDPKTRTCRITVKDPAAPDPLVTKIIQLKFAYATNLVSNVKAVLQDKRSNVLPDARTSQLIVVATEREIDMVDEIIARLDTPTKQVLIEARLIETTKNPTSAKGVDWTGTLQAQHFSFGNGNTLGTIVNTSGNTTAANSGTGSLPVGSTGPPFIGANPVTLTTTYPAPPGSGGTSTAITSATGTGATSGTTSSSTLTTATGLGGIGLNTAKGFFPNTAFLNADGVAGVLSFLNSDTDTKTIATPRSVTLDNETATLSVTTAYPIFQITPSTANTPGSATVTYTNIGTVLKVTPRISANNTVALKIQPEVSDDEGLRQQTVGGLTYQADIFDIRSMETQVLIPSGNTLVMGGLIADNQSSGYTKVPGFGDIPIIGNAFRSSTKTQLKRNLLIFITPTIVENEDFQPTESTFLKTKVTDGTPMQFGAWDNGKPQDWSKLFHKTKQSPDTDTDTDSGSN
jgi:type II secretory pathway component GspD/PulD (secretin)